MGLKQEEGGMSTVWLPTEIRLELKDKGWTILQAIKAGLEIFSQETGCNREECVKAKKRLADYIIDEEKRKGVL